MQDNIQGQFTEDDQESSLNIQKVFRSILSNWYWFIICIVLFIVVAETYLRYATPVYKVNAKILIKDDETGTEGSIDQTVMEGLGLVNGKTNQYNELDILN